MKMQVLSFLRVFGLLMLAGPAFAQNLNLHAKIPFSFSVNKSSLPAGQYEVRAINAAGGRALVIDNRDTNVSMIVLTNAVAKSGYSDKSKLVFKRYGNQYFLSQIWVSGSDTGREFPRSTRETELAHNGTPANVVVMAALQ
jgi:hypothetical protein